MTKHILGEAVYQIAVICAFLFAGDKFLPSGYSTNPTYPYNLFVPGTKYDNQSPEWKAIYDKDQAMMHHIANHNPESMDILEILLTI